MFDAHVVDTVAQGGNPPVENVAQWERLWVQLLATSWSSLGITPVDASIDPNRVGVALLGVGTSHQGARVQYVDARKAGLGDVQAITNQIAALAAVGHRVIVAVDAVTQNPASVQILRATSGILLVVRARESKLEMARKTLEAIGNDRILGSVFLE